MYTASALGTILPLFLVRHPILVLYRASIEVLLMLINLVVCSMEVNSSVSDRNLEGKILAAWGVFLILLTFSKIMHFVEM